MVGRQFYGSMILFYDIKHRRTITTHWSLSNICIHEHTSICQTECMNTLRLKLTDAVKGSDEYLHLTASVGCNYLSLPLILAASTHVHKSDSWWRLKWKHFPRYWSFAGGIHRPPVNSPHKGQWRGALMSTLICAWTNGWVNSPDADDLRRHRVHHNVTVMCCCCLPGVLGVAVVLGSPASVVMDSITKIYMMTSSSGNIFRVTDPLCGNSPVTGEFPAQRPVTRSFGVFFDLCFE